MVNAVFSLNIFGLARRLKIIGLPAVILYNLYFVEMLRKLFTKRDFNENNLDK